MDLADLTDAVALGRLTLAELATVNVEELEALHAIAVARLDAGLHDDARVLLAALVTLFPFRARAWRTYGVALQRCGLLEQAVAAYDGALLLDPHHGLTRCHRAEAAYLLGAHDESVQTISELLQHRHAATRARATALWQVMNVRRMATAETPSEPTSETTGERSAEATGETATATATSNATTAANPRPDALEDDATESDAFTLADGRALPLAESRFQPVLLDDATTTADATEDLVETTDDAVTSPASPLPDITGNYTKPEGSVITAVEKRRHGLPLTEDITLTSEGPGVERTR